MYDINRLERREELELLKKLRWKGFVYYMYDTEFSLEKFEEVKDTAESLNLKVFSGVKIRAEKVKELRKKIRKFRKKCHIVMVEGGNLKINREAVERHEVDILSTPELNRKDSGINHVLARLASEHRVAIEINFNELLHKDGYERARTINFFRRNLMLAKKYKAPVVICSDAKNIYEVKSLYDLRAFLNTLTEREFAKEILLYNKKICEFREYLSRKNVIRYGIEVVEE
ncbi:ribonuclease P protein component 3 [Methanocaldococcus infernus]